MADNYKVTERLYLTVDDKVVKEGDPKAAFLYATPSKEIPMSEAVKYGLARKASKAEAASANKAKPAPANKAKKKAGNR